MLETFLGRLERCTTVNLANRLHISLEMILAPAEIALLAAQVRERGVELPETSAHWLGRMETLVVGDGRPTEAYVRRTLADDASWYAAPGSPDERAERTVVIAFTGDAHRLFRIEANHAIRYRFDVFAPSASLSQRSHVYEVVTCSFASGKRSCSQPVGRCGARVLCRCWCWSGQH